MKTHSRKGRGEETSDDDVLSATTSRDDDVTGVLETPDDVDDPLLRRFDVAEPDRSHELHVLLDDLGGTRRHVRVDLLLEILTGGLERETEFVVVDFLENRLDPLVVDEIDVPRRRTSGGGPPPPDQDDPIPCPP